VLLNGAAVMKAVAAALLLCLLVTVAIAVSTPPQTFQLGTPVGCDVLTRDYPYDNCTPRPS
jgi:hypothetical protein